MPERTNGRQRQVTEILLLATVYALLGWLTRLPVDTATPSVYTAALWPSAGIALGALLLGGRALWPGVWLGAFVLHTLRLPGVESGLAVVTSSAAIATGATLQALLGHALAPRAADGTLTLDTPGPILRFFLRCGLLASLAGASFGCAALFIAGQKTIPGLFMDWLSWWTADTIGILLVTPAVLALGAQPSALWQQRRLTVALPLLLATILVSMALLFASRLEFENQRDEFERHASLLAHAIGDAFGQAEETSSMLIDLYRASRHVDRDEFSIFASGIHDRHPAILALEWLPRVPHTKLAIHQQATHAEGFADYRVFEKSADSQRLPASGRAEYFPVHYVHPLAGNEAALGFDLGSEALRRRALEEARRTRQTTVSGRVRLIEEKAAGKEEYGVLVVTPFFRPGPKAGDDGLVGYTLAVIGIGSFVNTALAQQPHDDIAIRLVDLDAPEDMQQLLHLGDESRFQSLPLRHVVNFDFGHHRWQMTFAAAGYRFASNAWQNWAMLAGSAMLSALLSFILLLTSGRSAHTEQLVRERSAELDAVRAEAGKMSQLLHEAVSSIAQGFTIYDEQDRLVVCNEAYKDFYAKSRDLIVPGATFADIVRRGAERGQYAEAMGRIDDWVAERVAQHQRANGEVIEQHLEDGRWLLIVEHRTPSGFIAGNRIDITAIKEAELALRKSESRANQIIENAPEAMLLVGSDGSIQQINGRAEALFGYERNELIGQSIDILVPDHLRMQHRHRRQTYAEHPAVKPKGGGLDLTARRKDGSTLPMEISLAPLEADDGRQVIVSLVDITERRRAAESLADRNAQLDAIFQLSPDGLVSFDRSGCVKYANPAFLRMSGLYANEIVGRSAAEFEARLGEQAKALGESGLSVRWPGLEACFTAAPAADGGATSVTPRHLLTLHRPREAILELLGVVSDAASVSRLLYVRDVTHEVEVDRMKSEFLSHAAHELRTPMASIYGFTELLMTQEFDAETRKDLLATIHRQTEWLVDIINELLDLARIESRRGKDFHIEEVALPALLREVVEATQIDPAHWPISIECDTAQPAVCADAAKLRQALTNVLGNAVKYSPAGGAIELRCVTGESCGKDFIGIAVSDHGIGMTPQQAARVGERFYRADTSGNIPGTGLGMAIVKEIVELLGGRLVVESAIGTGTTVTLMLPAGTGTEHDESTI